MSQGTLYTTSQVRGVSPKALIKHFKLDIAVEDKEAAAYKANFPLNKIPAFIGPKGFKLTEAIAINVYRMYLFLLILLAPPLIGLKWWKKFLKLLYSYPCLNILCRYIFILKPIKCGEKQNRVVVIIPYYHHRY